MLHALDRLKTHAASYPDIRTIFLLNNFLPPYHPKLTTKDDSPTQEGLSKSVICVFELLPSRSFNKWAVLIVMSPFCVSIFPDVFTTSLFDAPAAFFCIHRLFPAEYRRRRYEYGRQKSCILFAA